MQSKKKNIYRVHNTLEIRQKNDSDTKLNCTFTGICVLNKVLAQKERYELISVYLSFSPVLFISLNLSINLSIFQSVNF